MTDLSVLTHKNIVFVGGGNMATALIDGLLDAKAKHGIHPVLGVIENKDSKLDFFIQKGLNAALYDNAQSLLACADVVVLAVKPQVMSEVCAGIYQQLADKLIVSVAAGLGLDKLVAMTGNARIVRTMPNLPATVGLGATGLFATVGDDDKAVAEAIMAASGITVWVDSEDDLHGVTAVAGSAPAYFFYLLEQMIAKAVAMGLNATDAQKLASQAMAGAAKMAQQGDPATLRAKVCSKGGTTHAAISYLQAHKVDEHIAGAMQACYDRSVELGG